MSAIVIEGGKRLEGSIKLQGAKNGVLPILAATILCDGECVIHNCPNLSDVLVSIEILEGLGCKCTYQDSTVTVDPTDISNCEIPESLMRQMRSSVVFLGAIIGRLGKALISNPGGCELGPRPIDIHLSSLSELGVCINENGGYLDCECKNLLKGKCIYLSFPSVGATENTILASVKAEGTTVIHNCAKEPEISDLADFLNKAGAKISGAGSDVIRIEGVKHLKGVEHSVIPDRIVAATFMSAAAVTHGDISLTQVHPSTLVSILNTFRQSGCEIDCNRGVLRIRGPKKLKRIPTIRSCVYPGFPTDAGPTTVAMQGLADGTCVYVENIFQNRFKYIDELNRFGAKIKTEGKVAVIEGISQYSSASAECTDLRGGAALIIAALGASGTSRITKVHHIDRGYENIEEKLALLGASAIRTD